MQGMDILCPTIGEIIGGLHTRYRSALPFRVRPASAMIQIACISLVPVFRTQCMPAAGAFHPQIAAPAGGEVVIIWHPLDLGVLNPSFALNSVPVLELQAL